MPMEISPEEIQYCLKPLLKIKLYDIREKLNFKRFSIGV